MQQQPQNNAHRDETQLAREKVLFRYSSALQRGDFDIVAAVLHEAQDDPILERMVLDINAIYTDDTNTQAEVEAATVVQRLLQEHLPSGFVQTQEPLETPLTVGDVAARLQTEAAAKGQVDGEINKITGQLRASQTALPTKLSQHNIRQLFEELGINVSRRVQKLFRDTAIFLAMGRTQGRMRMAATRQQKQLREEPIDEAQPGQDEARQ